MIACEGTTEELYYDAVRRLSRVRGEVRARGRDPLGLVEEAHSLHEYLKRRDIGIIEVWCVFDNDGPDIQPAIDLARAYGYQVVVSTPCFEIWPLLHFHYSHRHLDCGEAAKRELRKHIPNYEESLPIYHILQAREEVALKRLARLRKYHAEQGNDQYTNPSTDADELLLRLRRGNAP
ncbi:MAG: RloB family protein [Armatimonadota bacterium]